MEVTRRSGLTEKQFVEEYLTCNAPVIVVGAMERWRTLDPWTPESLVRRFGEEEVQVYDQLFDLIDVKTLKLYIKDNFNKNNNEMSNEYVRWYTKFREVDFIWSDEVFKKMENYWEHPDFLPRAGYVIPYSDDFHHALDVTKDKFPYKGLFLSGKGGRTRLHRDPFGTQALLCQVFGRKRIIFYSPSNDIFIRNGKEFADPNKLDAIKFPDFQKSRVTFEDILQPGEILFIPDGWFHDVTSLDDSISITWNFVHRARLESFIEELSKCASHQEFETVRFFLSNYFDFNYNIERLISFLRR